MSWFLDLAQKINHFQENGPEINLLDYCLKFEQNDESLRIPMVGGCVLELLNRVIHRFRGYAEFLCWLNPLTI